MPSFKAQCLYDGTEFVAQDIADLYCCQECQDLASDMDDGMAWEPDFQMEPRAEEELCF